MKTLITYILLFSACMGYSQSDIAIEPNERQVKEAKALTQKLDDVLSFTEKQILLVEPLTAEYIARRDEIIGAQDLTLIEKNELLESIYVEQGNEMADILTRLQINQYQLKRGELQPLVVIKE